MLPLVPLTPGDVYEPKTKATPVICMQVGIGPEMGVFLGECAARTFERPPEFRVIVNTKSLKKHFRKAGSYPMAPGLAENASYGYKSVGSAEQYRVTLLDMDNLVPISQEQFDELPRLSAWEIEHIYRRLREGQTFFPGG